MYDFPVHDCSQEQHGSPYFLLSFDDADVRLCEEGFLRSRGTMQTWLLPWQRDVTTLLLSIVLMLSLMLGWCNRMLIDTFPMLVPELRRNRQISIEKGLSEKRATILEVVRFALLRTFTWNLWYLAGSGCATQCSINYSVDKYLERPNDLFSLYFLFCHCRLCDESPENCFFQMSRNPRAYARTTNEKTKGKFPWEHDVVWIGKIKPKR